VRAKKSKILRSLIIIAIFVALLSCSKTITNPLRLRLLRFFTPVLGSIRVVSSSIGRIMPFGLLREENRLFGERINLLNRKIEELKLLSSENDRLKSLLGFKRSLPYATIPAQVIGRDPSNWSNSLIIAKGIDDGLRDNRAVLSTKGLVGRIVEIGRYSAKVLLITDPNSKVGVAIAKNRQGGILTGSPGGMCKIVYISLDSDVAPGDKVITAGYGSIFPKDIMVGEVTKTGKEPGRLYKYAVVKPAEDLSRLEEVLCIK
jgi:rod shape-determining protein MreC